MRLRQRMTTIHGIPKNGMRAIQLRGHAGMLRSLTRKHESDRRIAAALQARSNFGCGSQPCREVLFQLCERPSGCGEAKGKLASANVSGVANVTDRCLGMVIQPLQELLDMRHQCLGAFGGKSNQARQIHLRQVCGSSGRRRLFKNRESIRAADPQAVQSRRAAVYLHGKNSAAWCSRRMETTRNRLRG